MTVQFRGYGEPRRSLAPFVSVPPSRLVRLLDSPEQIVQVYLHWAGSYSVPCLGEECDLCDTTPFLAAYSGCEVITRHAPGRTSSKIGIICFTDGCVDSLSSDLRDRLIHVSRSAEHKNAPMAVATESVATWGRAQRVDVKSRLAQVWAVRPRVRLQAISETIDEVTEFDVVKLKSKLFG